MGPCVWVPDVDLPSKAAGNWAAGLLAGRSRVGALNVLGAYDLWKLLHGMFTLSLGQSWSQRMVVMESLAIVENSLGSRKSFLVVEPGRL